MANWLHRCYGTNCVRACVCVFVGVLCVTLMHACVRACTFGEPLKPQEVSLSG